MTLFSTVSGDLLAALAAVFVVFTILYHRSFFHFKKMGVRHDVPLPFFGHFLPVLFKKGTFASMANNPYKRYKTDGLYGLFNWRTPVLVVCEPDLIKQVLTKDFSSFHDRTLPYDEEGDPLSGHLFNLSGNKWRNLRNKLSPTFTSGKLKMMYPLMADVAEQLNEVVRKTASKDKNVELKEFIAKYSVDLIGTCAFGMTCNSLSGGNQEFFEMSRNVSKPGIGFLLRFLLSSIHPKLARLIPFKLIFPALTNYFLKLMKDTVEYREKNKVVRNDFVNLMLQIREADKNVTDRQNFIEFSHKVMTAQAFIFFGAGLDNVSNTVSWALHELALNPDLQEQAAQEVREVIAKHEGKMTYEALQQMCLVERILDEAMRKYTPVPVLLRKAVVPTSLGSTGLHLEKDQEIFIPTGALHMDPDYFPDPERFDPDRFTQEAKQQRHPYVYLPFGEGPRVCIAERFAMLELKLCLASLLNSFKFSVGTKTELKPEPDLTAFGLSAKNGFWLSVDDRK